MVIPTWLATICVSGMLAFLGYAYKEIHSLMLENARITAKLGEIKERMDRIEKSIDDLR